MLTSGIASCNAGDKLVVLDGVASRCGDVNGAGLSGVIAQELQSIDHHSAGGTQGVLSIDDGLCTAGAIMGDTGVWTIDVELLVKGQVLFVSACADFYVLASGGIGQRGGDVHAIADNPIRGADLLRRRSCIGAVQAQGQGDSGSFIFCEEGVLLRVIVASAEFIVVYEEVPSVDRDVGVEQVSVGRVQVILAEDSSIDGQTAAFDGDVVRATALRGDIA